MGEDLEPTKRRLRQRLLADRRALSAADVARLSAAVCTRVAALPAFTAARRLVAYAPIDGEVDPAGLVALARATRKPVYYPRRTETGLDFVAAAPETLVASPRRPPEPSSGAILAPGSVGVVFLVPGVAFDVTGGRRGRGVGAYDRALAVHAGAVRIGLAYEFQVVDALPQAVWDARMDAVVTELRLLAVPGDPLTAGAGRGADPKRREPGVKETPSCQ